MNFDVSIAVKFIKNITAKAAKMWNLFNNQLGNENTWPYFINDKFLIKCKIFQNWKRFYKNSSR